MVRPIIRAGGEFTRSLRNEQQDRGFGASLPTFASCSLVPRSLFLGSRESRKSRHAPVTIEESATLKSGQW